MAPSRTATWAPSAVTSLASSTPIAPSCCVAASSPCGGSSRPCAPPTWACWGARLLDCPGVFPDRGEFSVLARSLHHHHCPARGTGRHRPVPVPHPHHAKRPRLDGRHHVYGRRHREQYSDGVL